MCGPMHVIVRHVGELRWPLAGLVGIVLTLLVGASLAPDHMGVRAAQHTAYLQPAGPTCAVTPGSGLYPTINSATTDPTCAQVSVPAGTFVEQVTIDHALTLTGAGQRATVIQFPVANTTPRSDAGNVFVLSLQAGGVTISGLTIDGQSYDCPSAGACVYTGHAAQRMGIDVAHGNVTIDHVTVQNLSDHGIGSPLTVNVPDPVIVKNSLFQDLPDSAVAFLDALSFLGNTVIGTGTGEIGVYGGAGTVVSGNTFTHFTFAPGPQKVSFISALEDAAVFNAGTVTNNTFDHDDNGVIEAFLTYPAPATIANNTFLYNQTAIVLRANARPQVVKNNQIRHTQTDGTGYIPGAAIFMCSERGDTVSGNSITDSALYGIQLYGSGLGAPDPATAAAHPDLYPPPGCPYVDNSVGNTISDNTIHSSSGVDLWDTSAGRYPTRTFNTYHNNTCSTALPASLCPAQGGVANPPTPAGSPTASPSLTPAATATGSAVVQARQPGSGDGPPVGVLVGTLVGVISLVGIASAAGFMRLRVRRPLADQSAQWREQGNEQEGEHHRQQPPLVVVRRPPGHPTK